MILEMNKIVVFGLHTDRKAILETLHKQEVVEICEPNVSEVNFKETEKSIAQFEKYMKSAESAIEILDEYAPEKSALFQSRCILPIEKYHMSSADSDEVLHSAYRIINLADKIKEHIENIRQITAYQMALEPYLSLDIPMNTRETGFSQIKIGTIDGIRTVEQFQKELEDNDLDSVHFEILDVSKERTCVWFIFPKAQERKMDDFLQTIGFLDPSFNITHHTPKRKKELLDAEKATLEREVEGFISKIKECNRCRQSIELLYDHLSLRKDKYKILSQAGMMEYTFLLEGYVPKKYGGDIKQLLESKWTVTVELEEPEASDNVPVAIQNNPFVAPVEGITETYSLPSRTDVDPNPIMAFFYYLFFGMMFSDAGYGLILVIICGYLGYSKRLEKPKRNNYRMFFFCGVSTTFWGLLYGSFFGDIIHAFSINILGMEIAFTPIWLDPISQAMELLMFSVALGMIQILIGMATKFYVLCRQKQVFDAICDVGLWMLVLVGISVLSVGIWLNADIVQSTGQWMALAGTAGIVLTGGRNNTNIIGKLLGGIIGLYGITGYVSDALSYCRLMALGLATGAISNVVNMLGTMFGNSFFGILIFIVIVLFGHSLNFAMNMLGAYVHTNRLQYVEFFSKFYEGGGRKFQPFSMQTKYYQFSEE